MGLTRVMGQDMVTAFLNILADYDTDVHVFIEPWSVMQDESDPDGPIDYLRMTIAGFLGKKSSLAIKQLPEDVRDEVLGRVAADYEPDWEKLVAAAGNEDDADLCASLMIHAMTLFYTQPLADTALPKLEEELERYYDVVSC